jgi:hypothetical protein
MTIQETRNTRTLIKEAELVHGSKDYVYNFYSNYTKSNDKIDVEDLDEETEGKLLDKNDPFIDITLAQFCFYNTTLKRLFSKSFSDDNLTLRLACLSNKMVGKRSWGSCNLPQALFDSEDNKEILAWFGIITSQELDVLFRNETINDNFLTELLELDNDLWMALSETNKLQVIRSLYYNERVCKAYDGPMDGYAEYTHGKLFSVIWDLAKKLPVEKKWSYALGDLLGKTQDNRYEFDSLEVAKRWIQSEEVETKKQFLSGFESVRYACYKNVIKDLSYDDKTNNVHYTNEDIAYRACAYVQTKLTEDNIVEAYAKDKLLAIQYIMRNMFVWRNFELRNVLKRICWDADSTINNSYLDCANMYNWTEERLIKKHPSWFKEDIDYDIDDDDEKVVTVGAGRDLIQEANHNQSVEILREILSTKQAIERGSHSLKLIFYGILALVLIEFFMK